MAKVRVKPAARVEGEGVRRVPDPRTGRPLPEEGGEVELSRYWRRRLLQGDVIRVEAPASRPRTRKDES